MRVLLVEDDEMIGQSLRDALDANGWSIDRVKDGLLTWACPSGTAPRCRARRAARATRPRGQPPTNSGSGWPACAR